MEFLTKHFRGEGFRNEIGGGERITEQAGYIPPDRQITGMMMAGKRLAAVRKEAYDFSGELPEELPEVEVGTYMDNLDLIDRSRRRQKEVNTQIVEYQAKKEEKLEVDRSKETELETKDNE